MLDRDGPDFADLPGDGPPLLLVTIDTEEEFDWSRSLARSNTAVGSVGAQYRAQEVFDSYGVVPVYLIDYPVASDEAAVAALGQFHADGRCEIGAHLHPWVNPPHEEPVNPYNSYPGNLPAPLERVKLERLTETIERNFGLRPTAYRAGRYGVGPATAAILEDLGYQVDLSVVPHTSFAEDGGPDFRAFGPRPYWFGTGRRLLEVPVSCGFAGGLAGRGPALFPVLSGRLGMTLHAPGVAARLGLLERIRLTPEGIDHAAHRRLTRSLLDQGRRVFCLTYHSPSLEPGNTPYVRDEGELRGFLDTIDRYLKYFLTDLGGQATTPAALYRMLAPEDRAKSSAPPAAEGGVSAG